ncbi:hypothetical protein ACVIJX_003840 [Bradyrhizobium diazoefficiens]
MSAASVWMTSSIVRPLTERIERPSAETHARGHGRFESERIADRDHELAAPQGLGVAERGIGQVAHAVGAQQRKIGVGIGAEHLGVADMAFHIPQPDLLGGADHMAVGEHEPIRRDHDARAEPGALAAVRHLGPGLDAHDGRADALGDVDHGIGIGVQQGPVIDRRSRCRSR